MFNNYLEENYYRIHKRTAIKNSTNSNILTWSSEDFLNKIYKLYQKSLDENTKHIALENYKTILTPSKNTQALRPDLYDFLLFRALDYFSNTSSYIHQTKEDFQFKTRDAFGDAQYFTTQHFLSANPKNFIYQSTLLYQKLINYYQINHYTKALDYVNILRLKFVKQHYQGDNAETYYLESLNRLVKTNPNSEALIELMNHAMQQNNYKKDLELVAIGLKSNNIFVQQIAKEIKATIMQQHLLARVEEVNLPNENILTQIKYRNIDQFFVKIFKLTPQQRSRLKEEKTPYKFIKTLSSFHNFLHNSKINSHNVR